MSDPKISVLLPVYNAEPYVAQAVESILNQTFADFEFIIINDGSTDGSLQILQRYAQQDNRIRLITRDNLGLVKTLNEGLSLARTPLIARMDADDVAYPERLYIQKDFLDKNPNHVLVGSRVLIIDTEGDPICEMCSHFEHNDIVDALLSRQGLIYHPSIMFRINDLLEIGGYRNKYPHCEDLDMFLRITERGKIENLKVVLLKYREHFQKVGYLHMIEQENHTNLLLQEAHEVRNLTYKTPSNRVKRRSFSIQKRMMAWAWWALKAKNMKTAKKYALRCFLHSPFSVDVWRLVVCVLRGY